MAKRADFTIEPDLMKGEIDEHGKLREPLVRLRGEPDHWTFYLKVGDRVCYDYTRRSARGDAWSLLAVVKPQQSGRGRIIARNGHARAPVLFRAKRAIDRGT